MLQVLAEFFTMSAFRIRRGRTGTTSHINGEHRHETHASRNLLQDHLQIMAAGSRRGGSNPRSTGGSNYTLQCAGLSARCGVFLAPWEDGFEDELYQWRNNPQTLHLWNGDRSLVTRRKLRKELDELLEKAVAFLIFREGQARPLGFVYACKASSPVQKHYSVGCFVSDTARGQGVGPAATALFVRYLFENFDIPKLEFTVYAWNQASLKATRHMPQFRLEGIRKAHVQYNGRMHDLYEFGLSRDDFEELQTAALWKRLVG
jgi:ribosomal-protein-serine acetyltransferase